MILRRVIAHFRKQEWTAIALDFLVGILIDGEPGRDAAS